MKISRINSLRGEVSLPGDKSISHRAAILASMARGTTRIENFSKNEDCASTLRCLLDLGVKISRRGNDVSIVGMGGSVFRKSTHDLDCGNSGTTMRLVSGLLAGQDFESVLAGDESLSKRPMARIINPLRAMGASIESDGGRPPFSIRGVRTLDSIEYDLPIASAQIESAILIAALNSAGVTVLRSPSIKDALPITRNHTALMLRHFGVEILESFEETDHGFINQISIEGGQTLTAKPMIVPNDVSAAAYFIVAASLLPKSDIMIQNVGLNPTRTAFIDLLKKCGSNVVVTNRKTENNEEFGDLRVRQSKLRSNKKIDLAGDMVTRLIDEIPILAILGTQLEGGLEVFDAGELRKKETDRIGAIVENLKRMNANVSETEDGFMVGKSNLIGAKCDSFGDHRIAMAFAIGGLFASGETEIINSECVNVSFPEFFRTLASVSNK